MNRLVLSIISLLVLSSGSFSAKIPHCRSVIRKEFNPETNETSATHLYLQAPEQKNFTSGHQWCLKFGGHLPIIHSKTDLDFLADHFMITNQPIWLARQAVSLTSKCDNWTDGSLVTYDFINKVNCKACVGDNCCSMIFKGRNNASEFVSCEQHYNVICVLKGDWPTLLALPLDRLEPNPNYNPSYNHHNRYDGSSPNSERSACSTITRGEFYVTGLDDTLPEERTDDDKPNDQSKENPSNDINKLHDKIERIADNRLHYLWINMLSFLAVTLLITLFYVLFLNKIKAIESTTLVSFSKEKDSETDGENNDLNITLV